MPISCVALFVFFVPILLYHLPGSHSPTPGFFSPLFMRLTKAFGCQGVPFGFSTSAYSHFAAVCSQRTAGAVRLVRGRDALTISDIGTISFVTCFSAEPHVASNVRYIAFSLSAVPFRWATRCEQRAVHCFFAWYGPLLIPCFQWERTPYSHLAKQGAVLSRYSPS